MPYLIDPLAQPVDHLESHHQIAHHHDVQVQHHVRRGGRKLLLQSHLNIQQVFQSSSSLHS